MNTSIQTETIFVHAGEKHYSETGSLATTLIRTKTYRQKFGVKSKWEYSRGQNPTRAHLEEKLAALEGGGYAATFASGLAAETMLFLTLKPEDNTIILREISLVHWKKVFSRFDKASARIYRSNSIYLHGTKRQHHFA